MLYQFFQDMLDILRLRYRHPATYLYTLPVVLAIIVVLGAINAVSMSPLLGNSSAAIFFAILLTLLKWVILSRSMRKVVSYYSQNSLPFAGFTLLSEALMIPMVLLFYVPKLAMLGLFYQLWIFSVQVIGFTKMGQVSAWKIAIGYILYSVITLIIGTLLLSLFMMAGWFDADVINQQLQNIMSTTL